MAPQATPDSKRSMPVAPNLLARKFTPQAPNRVWSGDITCIHAAEEALYLAIVLDLFNRAIVGWSIKPRMADDIIFHSDRGSPYAIEALYHRSRRHSTLRYSSPVQFLADWINKPAARQSLAA